MPRFKKYNRFDNSFARKASEMKIPNAYDNINYGKLSKIVARKVTLRSTDGSGADWGSKTIMTKEDVDFLLEDDDLTVLPDSIIRQIKSLIKKGADDASQNWENALELTNKAYQVAQINLPNPSAKGAWDQYESLISWAVKQLAAARGIGGSWRLSDVLYTESISQKRFFVEIPNEDAVEVDGDTLDEIIDTVVNVCRARGIVVKVDTKTMHGAILRAHNKNTDATETIVIKAI